MTVTPDDPWLSAAWSFVQHRLPPPPAAVLEIGCGRLGGFVPALAAGGYDAVGIDPAAPEGPGYRQARFEEEPPSSPADVVVASISLHHVADLERAADLMAATLLPGGTLVVLEWAWERFDAATARWCFARLPPGTSASDSWLRRRHDAWKSSGQPWETYFRGAMAEAGLHRGQQVVDVLDARFERVLSERTPYFFPDLAHTSAADEQAAIDAGEIQAACVRYVATRR